MKFPTGQVVWTRYINDCVAENAPFAKFVMESLKRHCIGDWGELDVEDKKANDLALQEGGRVVSQRIYNMAKKTQRFGLSRRPTGRLQRFCFQKNIEIQG